MSNTIKVQDLIVAEGLRILTNELVFTNKINRAYEDKFNLEVQDHRVGTSIRIPKPAKHTVRSGWARQAQNHTEDSVTLSIDTAKGVDCDFTDSELALLMPDPDKNMSAWSKRFLKPRITRLANEIDLDVFAKAYVKTPNLVGTPGTTPQTWGVLGDAMQKLDENLAPQDERYTIINAAARNRLSDALKGVAAQKTAENALLRGWIPIIADFEMFQSQNVPNHTVGAHGGTPLVQGGSQTGSSLATDGWTNDTTGILKKGDIFTISGVYMVNPVTKQVLPTLQQFVVTADANSGATTGPATLSIYPAIVTSGASQTVNASPDNDAPITVVGTASTAYAQNLAFHPDAFSVAFGKLITPKGTDMAVSKTFQSMTMRYVRDWNNTNAVMEDRLDVYYGTCELYPDWACRITG